MIKKLLFFAFCLILVSSFVLGSAYDADSDADFNNDVSVIWKDQNYDLYYTKFSGVDGSEIISDVQITNGNYVYGAANAVDSEGNVHIVWHVYSEGIYYNKLDGDTGTKMMSDILIAPYVMDENEPKDPDIDVDVSGNVHIVWHDAMYYSVFYSKVSGSSIVIDSLLLTPWGETPAGFWWYEGESPTVAVDTNGVHVGWIGFYDEEVELNRGSRSGDSDLYYSKIVGASVEDPLLVASGEYYIDDPSVGVGSLGDIYIAWEDEYGWEIYYSRVSWSSVYGPFVITDDLIYDTDPSNPSLVVGLDESIYVSYEVSSVTLSGVTPYIAYSKLQSDLVIVREEQVTPDGGATSKSSLSVGQDGDIHLIWSENGFLDYYKLFSSGTSVECEAPGQLALCGEIFGDCEEIGEPICCGDYGDRENIIHGAWTLPFCCDSATDSVDENGLCHPQTCDGVPDGQCTSSKPKYCDDGKLSDNCQECGCPKNYWCRYDGKCISRKKTLYATPIMRSPENYSFLLPLVGVLIILTLVYFVTRRR